MRLSVLVCRMVFDKPYFTELIGWLEIICVNSLAWSLPCNRHSANASSFSPPSSYWPSTLLLPCFILILILFDLLPKMSNYLISSHSFHSNYTLCFFFFFFLKGVRTWNGWIYTYGVSTKLIAVCYQGLHTLCLYDHKPCRTHREMLFSQSLLDSQFQAIIGYRILDSLGWKGLWGPPSRSSTPAARLLATIPASGRPTPNCPTRSTRTHHTTFSGSPSCKYRSPYDDWPLSNGWAELCLLLPIPSWMPIGGLPAVGMQGWLDDHVSSKLYPKQPLPSSLSSHLSTNQDWLCLASEIRWDGALRVVWP